VFKCVDGDVGGEVVDTVERLVECDAESFGRSDADEESADETRAAGDGDSVDVLELDARVCTGAIDRRHHGLEVCARSDLRDDATPTRMLIDAGCDGVSEQSVAADNANASFVA
jgi:hypothetical protein